MSPGTDPSGLGLVARAAGIRPRSRPRTLRTGTNVKTLWKNSGWSASAPGSGGGSRGRCRAARPCRAGSRSRRRARAGAAPAPGPRARPPAPPGNGDGAGDHVGAVVLEVVVDVRGGDRDRVAEDLAPGDSEAAEELHRVSSLILEDALVETVSSVTTAPERTVATGGVAASEASPTGPYRAWPRCSGRLAQAPPTGLQHPDWATCAVAPATAAPARRCS